MGIDIEKDLNRCLLPGKSCHWEEQEVVEEEDRRLKLGFFDLSSGGAWKSGEGEIKGGVRGRRSLRDKHELIYLILTLVLVLPETQRVSSTSLHSQSLSRWLIGRHTSSTWACASVRRFTITLSWWKPKDILSRSWIWFSSHQILGRLLRCQSTRWTRRSTKYNVWSS